MHYGFVEPSPSRVLRDGMGSFPFKLSDYPKSGTPPIAGKSLYGSMLLTGAAAGDAAFSLVGCGTEMSQAAMIAVMKASAALP